MKILKSFFICISIVTFAYCQDSLVIKTIYGSATITEPVLIELIDSAPMQRLKKINQYGILSCVQKLKSYTRFEHSLGVLFLLRHFGASLDEQVFGLLHDVSHTAFSHVADYLFKTATDKYSYQDLIFDWYIKETGIFDILQKHGFEHIAYEKVRTTYLMLKDNLPKLCADRLEYNLYGAYIEEWVDQNTIHAILSHLHYADNQWFFDSYYYAHLFAIITLEMSRQYLCSGWNCFLYQETAHLLRYALDNQIITLDDLHFSVDTDVWQKLHSCSDEKVAHYLANIKNFKTSFVVTNADNYTFYVKAKFRVVDPNVKTEQGIFYLSELDAQFKEYYLKTKEKIAQGLYFNYAS